VELTVAQLDELRDLAYCVGVPATVGGRARIMLWYAENRPKKDIIAMAGVSRPAANLWLSRHESDGVAGVFAHNRGAGREQMPPHVRARTLADSTELGRIPKKGEGRVAHHRGCNAASRKETMGCA
jgi:hypothetical protein